MTRPYEEVYYSGLLDDLHNFFPAILYEPTRFTSLSEMLRYIQDQMNDRFNIFNRARRQYQEQHGIQTPQRHFTIVPPPIGPTPSPFQRPRVAVGLTTETIDLTHLFTTGGGLGARAPGGDLEEFTVGGGAAGGGGILDQLANLLTRAAEPVVVAPTAQQIEQATMTRIPHFTDETNTNACAICQEPLMNEEDQQPLREITHCEHTFHQTCIDRWFTRNVRCPVCRFDIREHVTTI